MRRPCADCRRNRRCYSGWQSHSLVLDDVYFRPYDGTHLRMLLVLYTMCSNALIHTLILKNVYTSLTRLLKKTESKPLKWTKKLNPFYHLGFC
jgi:hypothetical protein